MIIERCGRTCIISFFRNQFQLVPASFWLRSKSAQYECESSSSLTNLSHWSFRVLIKPTSPFVITSYYRMHKRVRLNLHGIATKLTTLSRNRWKISIAKLLVKKLPFFPEPLRQTNNPWSLQLEIQLQCCHIKVYTAFYPRKHNDRLKNKGCSDFFVSFSQSFQFSFSPCQVFVVFSIKIIKPRRQTHWNT